MIVLILVAIDIVQSLKIFIYYSTTIKTCYSKTKSHHSEKVMSEAISIEASRIDDIIQYRLPTEIFGITVTVNIRNSSRLYMNHR